MSRATTADRGTWRMASELIAAFLGRSGTNGGTNEAAPVLVLGGPVGGRRHHGGAHRVHAGAAGAAGAATGPVAEAAALQGRLT